MRVASCAPTTPERPRAIRTPAPICVICLLFLQLVPAEPPKELPTPWPVPPYPVVMLPMAQQAPVIDGEIHLNTEWKDAVVLAGCYQRDLDALAPTQAQLQFFIKLDKEFLYVAARSPLFPKGSQLRAFEKRPDRPADIMAGDHMAMEVLPLSGADRTILKATGHFAFIWNSLGTLSDQHVNMHPGQDGLEWVSRADVRNRVTEDAWETEINVPVERFRNATMARHVSLPPKPGDVWGLRVARRFGENGENLFTTWDNADLAFRSADANDVPVSLSLMPRLRISEPGVAVQLLDLGDLVDGKLKTDIRFWNSGQTAQTTKVTLSILNGQGENVWSAEKTVPVPAGEQAVCPVIEAQPPIEERGSRLFIKITQDDGALLYITPGSALVKFTEATRKQYIRSLEVLRQP